MGITEEKMKILKMIQDGKINSEEAIKLLEAIETTEPEKSFKQPKFQLGRVLKVRISELETGKEKVNFSLPIGIAQIIRSLIPHSEWEKLEKQGVDLNVLFDSISSGQIGKLLDVEDMDNKQHIEIVIE